MRPRARKYTEEATSDLAMATTRDHKWKVERMLDGSYAEGLCDHHGDAYFSDQVTAVFLLDELVRFPEIARPVRARVK